MKTKIAPFLASILICFVILVPTTLKSQQRDWSATQIKSGLKKLSELSSVLYIAAHPDDENTRFIAYMANENLSRTAYLSLTRGDGGQNLIGTEKGPLMGLLRTHELLEARKIDGGEQFFTRAVDFGYSKNPEETFTKWDRDKVLEDVVRTIRKFQPDIIVTRFPPTKYAGHGHHSASAILAAEAYKLAADPKAYPEQVKIWGVWQAKRHFFNSSSWWDDQLEEKAKKTDSIITVDIGKFNPLLGKSYSEIASESRSMHKSQGFGSGKRRGTKTEYFILKQGSIPLKNDLMDGIKTSWARIKGGAAIGEALNKINGSFQYDNPGASVSSLIKVYKQINKLGKSSWKTQKLKETKELIIACAGIWLEASASDYSANKGDSINLTISALNRSTTSVVFKSFQCAGKDSSYKIELINNQLNSFKTNILAKGTENTNPYWLNKPFVGMYSVDKNTQIGNPINNNSHMVTFNLSIQSVEFDIQRPLVYKWTDPVKAEIYREFVVLPKVTANLSNSVFIFSDRAPQKVDVTIQNNGKSASGTVSLGLPKKWKCKPANISFDIKGKYVEKVVSFMVTAPKEQQVAEVKVLFGLEENQRQASSLVDIDYDHIPKQILLPEAKAKIVKLNVVALGKKIGYIAGAGDEVPEGLKQLGYEVQMLNEDNINSVNLTDFDAIITGIRAYNTKPFLTNMKTRFMDYIKQGGNMIVQYNTSHRLVTKDIGPYPLKLSRDRVTVEEAIPTFLYPNHPAMIYPNKIERTDFNGWVQERGLYFPNEWDDKYIPMISWNDPGEEVKKGALLICKHGEGNFVYTGISFFRELPAGVPGAYKLLANIISLGKTKQ